MALMAATQCPRVWFPAVRTRAGSDVFSERLADGLRARGVRAEICWLPLRAEYAPWTVRAPRAPDWANIVHVNTWLHPRFIPAQLPVVATLHHSMHDPALRSYKGHLRAAYHRWWITPIERAVLHRADKAMAVSQFAADIARNTLCNIPVSVIHNGVDIARFRPADRERQPNDRFRLLYVGSWREMKGVELLAPLMRLLGDEFELHCTVGEGLPGGAGFPPNMFAIGRLESEGAVVEAMQNADALVFPSRSEGFGLVAAEAMACGLPVIAFQGTSADEIVVNGEAGVLVPKNDVGAIVAAARRLKENLDARRKLSVAGRRRATKHYSLSKMVEAYIEAYLAILLQRNQ